MEQPSPRVFVWTSGVASLLAIGGATVAFQRRYGDDITRWWGELGSTAIRTTVVVCLVVVAVAVLVATAAVRRARRIGRAYAELEAATSQRGKEDDRRLFHQLLRDLPSTESIRFLREWDFGNAFHRESLVQFDRFVAKWDQPDREFVDPQLEQLRACLLDAMRKFKRVAAQHLFTVGPEMEGLPPEWDWSQPDRFETAQHLLNETADLIVEAYDTLVRRAREKLAQ